MTCPITERQNPLTMNIDAADPVGMVRMLRQSDAQIFSGFEDWPAVVDREMLEKMALVAFKMAPLFQSKQNVIFLSGAGTSGRFAHLLAMEYNRVLREHQLAPVFAPLLAGGDAALIRAQESAEDSAVMALDDLKNATPDDLQSGMYIGITAGVSAPYVAAQLDTLALDEKFHSVLLGFNPLSLARDKAVDGWTKTVKQVLDALIESDRFTMLNPVYGPEPITGSTRMKGGSVTRVVLDSVFALALELAMAPKKDEAQRLVVSEDDLSPLHDVLRKHLSAYAETTLAAYSSLDDLADLVRAAGTALRSGGRIIYLGRGLAGYIGLIDASECPPTFGAGYFDVRGYLREGWEFLGVAPAQMTERGREYAVDHEFFEKDILPGISKGDLVIAIATGSFGDNTRRLIGEANKLKATTAALLVRSDAALEGNIPENVRYQTVVNVPRAGFIPLANNEQELALKFCLNAITTCAHVMAGKVYTNVMIDLRISNSKLYDRAIGLISQLTKVSLEESRAALHHAIFEKAQTTEEIEAIKVSECVTKSSERNRVVPLAILLATKKFTFDDAKAQLASEPRVRRLIDEAINSI